MDFHVKLQGPFWKKYKTFKRPKWTLSKTTKTKSKE